MKTLDWNAVLDRHPLFQNFDSQGRSLLLSESSSVERKYPQDTVVLKEGETGDSLFMIGSGHVSIVLHDEHGNEVVLYSLGTGEVFGEMAVLEQRPRSATAVTAEPSVLLEIKGDKFLTLMKEHHEIGFYLLTKLSQRLRYTDDRILDRRIKGVNESLDLVKSRFDGIVQATDAKLAASQTMFEETNQRADEVINSAERARTRFSWAVAIIAPILAILSVAGLWDLKSTKQLVELDAREVSKAARQASEDARDAQAASETAQGAASNAQQALDGLLDDIDRSLEAAEENADKIDQFRRDLETIRENASEALADVYLISIIDAAANESYKNTITKRYKELVNSEHSDIVDKKLLTGLQAEVLHGSDIRRLVKSGLQDQQKKEPMAVIITYYFHLLSSIFKNDKDDFEEKLAQLDRFIALNKGKLERSFPLTDKHRMTVKTFVTNQTDESRKAARTRMLDRLFETLAQLPQESN